MVRPSTTHWEKIDMFEDLKFEPLIKKRLYEDVANQIKKTIFNGKLKPGDSLPSERELCKMFNVGRPTIREALRTLSMMGLIEVNHGIKGSVVRESNIRQYVEIIREQLLWLIKSDYKTIDNLREIRKYVELGIVHSAAQNCTAEHIERLETLIKEMEACADNIHVYFPISVEFHKQLALMTRNKIFYFMWEILYELFFKGYAPILEELFPEGPSKLFEANRVLLNALKSKDPNAIGKAVEIHTNQERKFFSSRPSLDSKE